VLVCTFYLHYSVQIFLMKLVFVVNLFNIPHGKPVCWRSIMREAGGEKVNVDS
jgi:hypothetical protein